MSLALALDYEAAPEDRALRAALYGRQSKGKSASIDEQLELGQLRTVRQGWPVVAALSDGISASRFATRERDDWPRLLALVMAREIDVIWLWESSRGDRKLSSWAALLEACQERGIFVWVETHGRLYDLANPRDMRTLGEEGTDNVYESEKIASRTNRAKDSARRDGALRTVAGGAPPLGYQDGPDDWETYPPVAAVLRDVAARVLKGASLSEAFRAQPETWTLPYGKMPARRVTERNVRQALTRPVTAGLITGRDGAVIRQAIADPPLDPATWRKVHAIFAGRKRGRNPTGQFPYGAVLRCAKCGNQLTGGPVYYRRDGKVKRVTASYRCQTPHPFAPWKVTKPCRGVSIAAAEVNAIIREAVDVWAAESQDFKEARDRQAGLGTKRIELEADLADARDRMADLFEKYSRRQIARDRYQAADAEISQEISDLEGQLDRLAGEEADPLPVILDWNTMPVSRQLRVIRRALVTPVTVHPGRGGARPVPAAERMEVRLAS